MASTLRRFRDELSLVDFCFVFLVTREELSTVRAPERLCRMLVYALSKPLAYVGRQEAGRQAGNRVGFGPVSFFSPPVRLWLRLMHFDTCMPDRQTVPGRDI